MVVEDEVRLAVVGSSTYLIKYIHYSVAQATSPVEKLSKLAQGSPSGRLVIAWRSRLVCPAPSLRARRAVLDATTVRVLNVSFTRLTNAIWT
jgi:hypothetical protein